MRMNTKVTEKHLTTEHEDEERDSCHSMLLPDDEKGDAFWHEVINQGNDSLVVCGR